MADIGRPLILDNVIRHRQDGTPVTVAEQVVERIQLGQDLRAACASVGIQAQHVHRWRTAGARLRAQEANGATIRRKGDRRLIEFCDALERAEDDAELSRLAIIQGVARGGGVVTKVTEKRNAAGDLLERTTVTETMRPEWTAAAWWLERRRPEKYRKRLEVTGADGAPLVPPAEAARNLADELRAYMAGAADARTVQKSTTEGANHG